MGILKYVFILFLLENAVDVAFANEVTDAFENYGIIPDYVPKAPERRLEAEYGCDLEADLGNQLTPAETKDSPNVAYNAVACKYYTLCMCDHDVPSQENSTLGEFVHWLVGNIPGDEVSNGDELAEYIGPEPPSGTAYHRYVFLAYEQPDKIYFDKQKLNYTSTESRYKFSISEFAKTYNLGNPVAGNFFLAEYDGTT